MNKMDVVVIVAAYLLGSLSFAVIVSKVMGMDDPRSYGSKNPGATNVLRSGKKTAAALTLLGDGLKGFVAVLAAQLLQSRLGLNDNTIALTALAVLVGHMWPLYFGFKGGKGVATAAGVFFALSWPVALICLAVWLVLAFGLKISSLAALIAASTAPIAAGYFVHQTSVVAAIVIIVALVIYRHKSNIQNLIQGKEGKIGANNDNA